MREFRNSAGAFTILELLVTIAILTVLSALLIPAVMGARAANSRTRCSNNLRQIGLGLHQYNDERRVLPPGMNDWSGQYAFLAWSARVLPYLDQGPLWVITLDAFRQQPYFSRPTPHPGLATVLPIYLCPSDGRDIGSIPILVDQSDGATLLTPTELTVAYTFYLGVSGSTSFSNDGLFYKNSKVRLDDIRDGTSNTLMIGERPPSPIKWFGWWYAGVGQDFDGSADYLMSVAEVNRTFRLPMCPRGPYQFGPGSPNEPCDTLHFWSSHLGGGANFLFADGSVHFLTYSANPIMPALASRAGGEAVTVPD